MHANGAVLLLLKGGAALRLRVSRPQSTVHGPQSVHGLLVLGTPFPDEANFSSGYSRFTTLTVHDHSRLTIHDSIFDFRFSNIVDSRFSILDHSVRTLQATSERPEPAPPRPSTHGQTRENALSNLQVDHPETGTRQPAPRSVRLFLRLSITCSSFNSPGRVFSLFTARFVPLLPFPFECTNA
jgi:hypothetical protein